MATNSGTIYLVGTGPGDLGLITVKGLALIREAEAIVGDLLSHARLMQEARPEAERYDAGCRTSRTKIGQEQVNEMLIKLAREGKMIVRLWPGDPFVYGRAAQEIAAIRRAGLRVELVPGVTSAIAVPAYAGVPVTHWEYATSFAVVTGYESKNPQVRPNWKALAQMETLVILMPLDDLPRIVNRLLAAGRPAGTPAAAVQGGTLPQQRQVVATLGTIAEAVVSHQIHSPAIVIVGQVVGLAGELAWFQTGEARPLLGKRVLVTRPAHQAADFMAALRSLGAEPIPFPTIEIRPAEDVRFLDQAIRRLGGWSQRLAGARTAGQLTDGGSMEFQTSPYDWLVLTSANGVTAFWERLEQSGYDSRVLATVKVAAIGPATAAALKQRSIKPNLMPTVYTAEGILAAFDEAGPIAGQRILLARADIARKALTEGLVKRAAVVEEIAAYRTVPVEGETLPPAADIVTFTSSSTVQGYVNCLGGRSPATMLKNSQVVCIGPITAATAKALGVPVSAVAKKYTIEGMLETLKEVAHDNRKSNFEG